jgi:hypothetical protein
VSDGPAGSPSAPATGDHPPDPVLATIALAQLACGLAGLVVAVRRRRAYDVTFLRGAPERVTRDAFVLGTALSAPGTMLGAQAVLIPVVAFRGGRRPARGLALLGTLMCLGYPAERLVRARLRPGGWDAVETPIAVLGSALAACMAVLGGRPSRAQRSALQDA